MATTGVQNLSDVDSCMQWVHDLKLKSDQGTRYTQGMLHSRYVTLKVCYTPGKGNCAAKRELIYTNGLKDLNYTNMTVILFDPNI